MYDAASSICISLAEHNEIIGVCYWRWRRWWCGGVGLVGGPFGPQSGGRLCRPPSPICLNVNFVCYFSKSSRQYSRLCVVGSRYFYSSGVFAYANFNFLHSTLYIHSPGYIITVVAIRKYVVFYTFIHAYVYIQSNKIMCSKYLGQIIDMTKVTMKKK